MFQGTCHTRVLGGVLAALLVAAIAVTITAQAPTANTINACVNSAGLVRIIPFRAACVGGEQPIQWNITGPAGAVGPQGPAGPAGPQGPPGEGGGPMNFTVDCANGGKVNAALDQGWDRSGRLFITIRGVCNESVTIHRDDVILMGESPGDGLAVPSTDSYPLGVAGGQRVALQQLTLQGGGYGLLVSQGAAVTGDELHITGAQGGLSIWDGTVRLSHSVIENSAVSNVGVGLGGTLFLSDSTVQGAKTYEGISVAGGSVSLDHTTVQGNNGTWGAGLGIMQGQVRIANSTITNNGAHGIWLSGGGVSIADSVIAFHTFSGLGLGAATADLQNTTIEDNLSGIRADVGSRVMVHGRTIIRRNSQFGIWLGDTSVVSGSSNDPIEITGNGAGIVCGLPPAVAQITPHYTGVGFSLNESHVKLNGSPQIRCPDINVQ